MSHYSHLPVYVDSVSFLKELYARIPKFSKQYKYLLGGKLIEYNTKIISGIYEASNTRDKEDRVRIVNNIAKDLDFLIIHVRISNELNQFVKEESYLFLSEKLVHISNQIEGWKKFLSRNC